MTRAIRDAGWRAQAVSLTEERVTFRRLNTEAINDDEPLKSWGTTDEDADAARYMWQNLSPTARRLFETLMSVAPAKVSASDLAQQHDILGATGVAGVLAWPARYAANAGRHPPINWEPGNPSQYWIEDDVAQVFRAAQVDTA